MTQHVLPVPAFSYPASCECCANCVYFYQHYQKYISAEAPGKEYFAPLNYGHCTYPRLKNRNADDVCLNFMRRRGRH